MSLVNTFLGSFINYLTTHTHKHKSLIFFAYLLFVNLYIYTDRETERHKDIETKKTDNQANRQFGKETNKPTSKEIDKNANILKESKFKPLLQRGVKPDANLE